MFCNTYIYAGGVRSGPVGPSMEKSSATAFYAVFQHSSLDSIQRDPGRWQDRKVLLARKDDFFLYGGRTCAESVGVRGEASSEDERNTYTTPLDALLLLPCQDRVSRHSSISYLSSSLELWDRMRVSVPGYMASAIISVIKMGGMGLVAGGRDEWTNGRVLTGDDPFRVVTDTHSSRRYYTRWISHPCTSCA